MTLETESAAVLETLPRGPGMTITRASDAHPHAGRKQRGSEVPGFELHPAIARGMQKIYTGGNSGGAMAVTLFVRRQHQWHRFEVVM